MGLVFAFVFVVICGLIGRWIMLAIFDSVSGYEKPTYIDKSVHHHYHDIRTINLIQGDKRTVFKPQIRTVVEPDPFESSPSDNGFFSGQP